MAIQRHRNPFWDFFFKFATFCGDKLFYFTMVPSLFWLGIPEFTRLGRSMVLLLTLAVYIGNFLKELFALPRPPSPPVWRNKREHDYGLPSAHTMSSLSASIFLVIHLVRDGFLPLNFFTIAGICVWVFSVAGSRLYLGHHSPADVVAGTCIGLSLTAFWLKNEDLVDIFITKHPSVPIAAVLVLFFLTMIHPRSVDGTPSYGRSVAILGLASGVVYGSWTPGPVPPPDRLINFLITTAKDPIDVFKLSNLYPMLSPFVWNIFLRLVIGFVFVNILFFLALKVTHVCFHAFLKARGVSHVANLVQGVLAVLEIPSFEPIGVLKEEVADTVKAAERSIDQTLASAPGSITSAVTSQKSSKGRKVQKVVDESMAGCWSKYLSAAVVGYMMSYTVPTALDTILL